MGYIFFSLCAAVCFAVSQILNKLLSKHSIDNRDSLMAYFMLSTGTFAVFLLPFVPWQLPNPALMQQICIAVCLFLLGYYCFFSGVFEVDASSFAPLFQLQSVFIGLLTLVLGIERFEVSDYLWMIVMIAGAIVVSYDEKMSLKSFCTRGMAYILFMQVFHAASNIFVSKGLQLGTPVEFLFWENILISIIGVIFIAVRKPKMKFTAGQIAPMFVASYVVGLGVIALLTAFKENLTISSVLGLLSSPIVFVISLIASRFAPTLLEHHSAKVYLVRGVGLVIILFGAVKLILA